MKKVIIGFVVIIALFTASCKKDNSSSLSNSWTFKGQNYNQSTCLTDSALRCHSTSPSSDLWIVFANVSLPITGGVYTVPQQSNSRLIGNQIAIQFNDSAFTQYWPTGGNGTNQTVTVSVSNLGKITVSGSGIELYNSTNPGDSSSLNFNISQP